MSKHSLRRFASRVFAVLGIAVLLALSTGEASLVTTHGVSMEPRFHTGDLAIIVRGAPYHLGEVVGYESPLLHITVLHRIVAEHNGLFTFKGDNNDFLDPLALPPSSIKGRLWVRIPHGGTVLGWLRSPSGLGLLVLAVLGPGVNRASHRRQKRRARALGDPAMSVRPGTLGRRSFAPGTSVEPSPLGLNLPVGMPVAWWPMSAPLALACLFSLLAFVAWSTPLTHTSQRNIPYSQHVTFSYQGVATPSVTYPTGSVRTGDPVFLRLVKTLNLDARYTFVPSATAERSATDTALSGTIGAVVTLAGPGGWNGQLAAAPPVAFQGPTAHVNIAVSLSRIATLEKALRSETGMALGTANVVVTPTVHISGSLAGKALSASDAPQLALQVNGEEIDLPSAAPNGLPPRFPQLTPESSGQIAVPNRVATSLSILGRSVAVESARRLSLLLVAVFLTAGIVGLTWLLRRRRMGETARIRAAFGHELITLSSSPTTHGRSAIDVASFAMLLQIARRYDAVILEYPRAAAHAYYVECGATLYRWETAGPTHPESPDSTGTDHKPGAEHNAQLGNEGGRKPRQRHRRRQSAPSTAE
jgi:signal peptidase I